MAANWESLEPRPNPRITAEQRAIFHGAWHEHRQVYGYTLLAELPFALRNALVNHPDLDGVAFELLIVDEYQDLNACDLELLHLISERGCAIVAAGDDDQSIYSFRCAAPEGIRRFPEDYPDCALYPLSITQRCGRQIIEWATYVIEGDPDRPKDRPRLHAAEGSADGEAAILAFEDDAAEAQGAATLVQQLIERDQVQPKDILVLMRGDHNGMFSNPIKAALDGFHIAYSDPEAIDQVLAEPQNRLLLQVFRLLDNPRDSLAWAGLLNLTPGIGVTFTNYIYERARADQVQFGEALLAAYDGGSPTAPVRPKRPQH